MTVYTVFASIMSLGMRRGTGFIVVALAEIVYLVIYDKRWPQVIMRCMTGITFDIIALIVRPIQSSYYAGAC